MATHSSVLAMWIPGTGEPGGLPSMGSHRVGHDWSDLAAAVAVIVKTRVHRRPWWPKGWESACRCRRHGFSSGSGKIPHATEQLSPCTTTTEPILYSPRAATTEPKCCSYWSLWALASVLCNERPPQWEAWAQQLESNLSSPQPGKASVQQQRLSITKKKKTDKMNY